MVISLILFVILVSYANGSNDVSKGIATLVGSGITDYKKAIIWGTIWTIAGGIIASIFTLGLLKTFSTGGLVNSTANLKHELPIAVSLGAFIWVIFATRTGLPVSTTHSITGALIGAGIAAAGISGVYWSILGKKIFLPLAFSPLIALAIAWLFSPLINKLSSRVDSYCICFETTKEVAYRPVLKKSDNLDSISQAIYLPKPTFMAAEKNACKESLMSPFRFEVIELFHWLSAGMTSFARGLNDAPKIAALALGVGVLGAHLSTSITFLLVSLAMGLGSIISGLRVTKTLAEKVTPMTPQEGFSANLTTSLLVTIASRFGLPVSTTHVSSGAIIGVGLKHGLRMIGWKTVTEMILAWLITLPVSAILSYFAFHILSF